VVVPLYRRTTATDEEIQIGATVGLEHVVDVEPLVSAVRDRR
jgi:hypothetical protein